jgi:hypothetical protein
MQNDQFTEVVQEQITRCLTTLDCKNNEYGTEDRLHNFKVAAVLQDVIPTQALAGMMAKHTVSVYDMCRDGSRDLALWNEKITDNINYLLLLRALVEEEGVD